MKVTEAESSVLLLLPTARTIGELATTLKCSHSTVKHHIEHVNRSVGTENTRALASLVTAVLWWAAAHCGEALEVS